MRKRNGFTLIEMLTVLAVLGVVSTVGIRAFVVISDEWNTTTRRMDLNTRAVQIFDAMRKDFDRVLPSSDAGVFIRGIERLEEDQRYGLIRLEDDRIILPVETRNPETGIYTRQSVMYVIDRMQADAPVLKRVSGALDADKPAGAELPVGAGVLAMRIEYYDGSVWQKAWKGSAMPESVAVSITLADQDRPWEQISRRAEFPVYVN